MTIKGWRVGSLSMGITLLLLGVAVAISIWSGMDSVSLLLWVAPVVFILLGSELLLYLRFAGNEKIMLRYDWMSIFFVAVIGSGSIVMASLASTGVLDEFQEALQRTERSIVVQSEPVSVPDGIQKIVVQAFRPIQLDEGTSRDLQLVGQVQYWSVKPFEKSETEDILSANVVGSTMYVMVGSYEHKNGAFVSETVNAQLTLVLPKEIEVVQRGF
ncbi:MAG: hypothetical protein ACE3L7_17155 [Candidatus Pristimantibacillus sp.]